MTLALAQPSVIDYVTASAVASPAAETVILATDAGLSAGPAFLPGPPPQTARPVKITVTLNITEGTTGTAFVVKLRQGNTTGGTQVGLSETVTLAAAASAQAVFVFRDPSGLISQPGGIQYCVTVTETGATVAGTVNAIDIEVEL
jgi:hypothetical protein